MESGSEDDFAALLLVLVEDFFWLKDVEELLLGVVLFFAVVDEVVLADVPDFFVVVEDVVAGFLAVLLLVLVVVDVSFLCAQAARNATPIKTVKKDKAEFFIRYIRAFSLFSPLKNRKHIPRSTRRRRATLHVADADMSRFSGHQSEVSGRSATFR